MEYNQNLPRGNPRTPVLCWGHKSIPKQKGIITYTLSPNRQQPLAHALHNAIFNTARRTRSQFLYVAPPFILAYLLMSWAEDRNKTLNSKAGRAAEAQAPSK